MLIHERSRGIPRTISVVCDNALLTGFGLGRQPVDSEVVLDVAHDFDLGGRRMADPSPFPQAELVAEPADPAASVSTEAAPREASPKPELDTEDERQMFTSGAPRRPSRFSLFGRN